MNQECTECAAAVAMALRFQSTDTSMDYINKASELSRAYRTLGERDIDDIWEEVQDLQGKIAHRVDIGNTTGEEAKRERQRYTNLALAGMEKRAMMIFEENPSYQNLPIENMEKLAKGERVENPNHDGKGALAHMNVHLVDFSVISERIDSRQIIPYHTVSLLGCQSIQVISGKKSAVPDNALNTLQLRPGHKKDRELLFEMWNDTMSGDSCIDEETLVYGYLDPEVMQTQNDVMREHEECWAELAEYYEERDRKRVPQEGGLQRPASDMSQDSTDTSGFAYPIIRKDGKSISC